MARKVLWVCWVKPNCLPSANIRILSFLKPSDEKNLYQSISEKNLISGRSLAQEVKDDALKLYAELVAHIGITRNSSGASLRELLKSKGETSLWWYHPVSFKDCVADPTFNHLIKILVIDRLISEGNFEKIVLWGSDAAIVSVLKTKYRTEGINTKKKSVFLLYFRAFGSRLIRFIEHVYHWYLIRKGVAETAIIPNVVFEGFWDWSIRPSKQHGDLDDRYFKSLPNILEQKGINTAWAVWFSPHAEPGLKHRSAKEVLKNAYPYKNITFLQKYLTLKDIIRSFSNFNPAIKYFSFLRSSGFRNLFNHSGMNLFPLFKYPLLYHFMSSTIPHHVLVEKASYKAFKKFRPKLALTFLEMFPHSKAFYTGVRQGSPETKLAAMQHASYSREKTFVRLDAEIEFYGKPDNCPTPKPDYVFAMGELGKKIFQECGFAPQHVFLTGSARYEDVSSECIDKSNSTPKKTYNVLMVTSLDRDSEMDMVDAVYCATKELPCVKLFLRNHPFARMDEHPFFQPMRECITITSGTLDEDLHNADLLLFSYSTVAEESLIKGIPVWQWRSADYNGSAFRDLHKAIPSFSSARDLREAMKAFLKNPSAYIPTDELRRYVIKNCFYLADGKASERIAGYISDFISSPAYRV